MKKEDLTKENESLLMDLYYAEVEKKDLQEQNAKLNNYVSFLLTEIDKLTQENLSLEKRFRFAHAS